MNQEEKLSRRCQQLLARIDATKLANALLRKEPRLFRRPRLSPARALA